MTDEGDDRKVGYKRPPKHSRWKKGQSGNPKKQHARRIKGRVAFIDELFLSPVGNSVERKSRKVLGFEGIFKQIMKKELAGSLPALKVRLRYEEFANRFSTRKFETVFRDNQYTQAMAASATEDDDDV